MWGGSWCEELVLQKQSGDPCDTQLQREAYMFKMSENNTKQPAEVWEKMKGKTKKLNGENTSHTWQRIFSVG